jgi:hypothetical protein
LPEKQWTWQIKTQRILSDYYRQAEASCNSQAQICIGSRNYILAPLELRDLKNVEHPAMFAHFIPIFFGLYKDAMDNYLNRATSKVPAHWMTHFKASQEFHKKHNGAFCLRHLTICCPPSVLGKEQCKYAQQQASKDLNALLLQTTN